VTAVRVVLPGHLRTLAQVGPEVTLDIADPPTLAAALDAVEAAYPVLRGTIRDHGSGRRRAFVRYFACEQDLSHEPAETPLPARVVDGSEPLMIVGAMAGG
jgi:hypothetical protein